MPLDVSLIKVNFLLLKTSQKWDRNTETMNNFLKFYGKEKQPWCIEHTLMLVCVLGGIESIK